MTRLLSRTGRWAKPWAFLGGLVAGGLAGVVAFLLAGGPTTAESSAAPPTPLLVEETDTSGIKHVYDGDFRFNVGGGVAVLDCDDDGKPDLYLAGGEEPAALFRNVGAVGGALEFTAVPDAATDLTAVTGAYPLDIDADGILDLAVLRFGENVLLRGQGGCRFERANQAWSFDGGRAWTEAFSATWEQPDGWPTLAFGNYLEVKADEENARGCADSVMYRPEGAGYGQPITLTPSLCTLSMLFSDWNHTGRHDLRLANDRHYYTGGEEQLFRVDPGEPPRPYTREEGWQPLQIWGMGIAMYDVTGDGLPEVSITSQGDNRLQTLIDDPSRPTYGDIAIRRGVTAHRPFMGDQTLPSTAWHTEFADVNNDGIVDLYYSKGNVDAQPDHAAEDPSNLLIGNPDGTFTERARDAGLVSLGRSRGAALADFNLDGMLDVVEVNRGGYVRLWRNVGSGSPDAPEPMGHWLGLRLEQPGTNRDAIGAWIQIRTDDVDVSRQLTIGGGHAGGQLGWIHVGLGEADGAEVRVTWPDGEVGPWLPVDADQFAVIERGATSATVWPPTTD